ncbi:MAG: carboxypeptidase-like regulatory domain-containing protein [Chitinophagaceae bacterium]|nr:carboxypeptidase-like regulatory domain-containing protein [Chitinophagaceae bacterium]
MKKIFSCLLPVIISLTSFAQADYVISGKVIDGDTNLPLQGASVFAENTTIGTATNNEGTFFLQLPNGGYSIVISFTGYQTVTRRVTSGEAGNRELVIVIKKKEKSLDEFVVKATFEVANGLEKYGDFFMENFIGKTANSKQCYIKNKEALKFFYYRRAKRLKILATEPLEIVNDALGYTIKYELDSFIHEYNTQLSLYTGFPLFREMQSGSIAETEKWDAARKVAYEGSILHFMRSVFHKKLNEAGFEIQFIVKNNNIEMAIPLKDYYGSMRFYRDDSSNTVEIMPIQKEMAVIYKNETPSTLFLDSNRDAPSAFQLSVVSFLPNETLDIEQNGFYYEQKDITINGYWAWEKIADMLPYDYKDRSTAAETIEVNTTAVNPAPPVTEQPKPVNNGQVNSNENMLTGVTWKMEESRVIDGNSMLYYKRGAAENTINFDHDLYKFNTGNTGIYYYNGQEYQFTWKYVDAEKTRMEMQILYPTPLIVQFENIMLTSTSFKYTRMQKVNGINFVAIETRTVK